MSVVAKLTDTRGDVTHVQRMDWLELAWYLTEHHGEYVEVEAREVHPEDFRQGRDTDGVR